jgi:TolA-binding protein
MTEIKQRSFWTKPEGVTGAVFLGFLAFGSAFLVSKFFLSLIAFVSTTVGAFVALMVLGTILFMALDGKTRALVSYMYKSAMRWLTGLFVNIDPIGILKNYVAEMRSNLTKMNRQIGQLRGQMHKLQEMIVTNKKEIESNLSMASEASQSNQKAQMILKSRKAGRLQDSNLRLEDLYKKMEILYRVLTKMYENSNILVEDVTDQVEVKEQERQAILASNSAMKSAMSVIKGDPDKRAMFDAALETIADDVAGKMGEMERFMDMSKNFMQSIDLQNGVFEEEGLKMLEKWENESVSLLLGDEKPLILKSQSDDLLDINEPIRVPEKIGRTNQYDNLFD